MKADYPKPNAGANRPGFCSSGRCLTVREFARLHTESEHVSSGHFSDTGRMVIIIIWSARAGSDRLPQRLYSDKTRDLMDTTFLNA